MYTYPKTIIMLGREGKEASNQKATEAKHMAMPPQTSKESSQIF